MGDMMNPNGAGHELVGAGPPLAHQHAANNFANQIANHNLAFREEPLDHEMQHRHQAQNNQLPVLQIKEEPIQIDPEEEGDEEVDLVDDFNNGAAAQIPEPANPQPNINQNINQNVHYNLNDVPDKEIYYKLIEMFPYTDFNEIRRILIHPPFDPTTFDRNSLITQYTLYCLDLPVNPEPNIDLAPANDLNKTACCAMLEDIFPDADPMFLAEFAEVNKDDVMAINNFIEENMINPAYPSREQYLARQRRIQFENEFINDFNVEHFLRLYENPFEHFGNPERKFHYSESALNFLKHQHNTIKVADIKHVYVANKYHLTLTDRELSQMKPNMKAKRYQPNSFLDEDILHEVAFLKNKDLITDYFQKKAEAEAQEYNECKAQNLLVDCECCYESIVPSKVANCSKAHIFCKSCLMESIKVKMTDGLYSLQCITECDGQFKLADVKKVLSESLFEIFFKKYQAEEVTRALKEELESCPFCGSLGPVAEEDKIFKCPDPKCLKESCRKCKAVNHLPMKCKDILETEKARLLIEEKMTLALIRKCSNCHRSLCKDDGCNKIKCPNCHTVMCYLCNTVIHDNYKHFRGQGSERFDLCPLWSDDQQFDTEYVKKVALETKQQVESQNPNIKIDIDVLLPTASNVQTQSKQYAETIVAQGDKFAEFARLRDEAAKKVE